MALVSTGSDKCREAAADALAALGDVAARDPANRELLKLKVRYRPLWVLFVGTRIQTGMLWVESFCNPDVAPVEQVNV